jgi:5-hydroxyisourate hydrolase-like protein (transthyretin family)
VNFSNPIRNNQVASMKNIFKWTILFFIITLSGCSLPYPRTYSSEELEGRIVDEDTGVPLEGVNVVAYWELYKLGFQAMNNGVIKVMETVTDADGRFHFPAWEPELVLRAGTLYEGIQLTFFKSGYVVIGELNYSNLGTVQPGRVR